MFVPHAVLVIQKYIKISNGTLRIIAGLTSELSTCEMSIWMWPVMHWSFLPSVPYLIPFASWDSLQAGHKPAVDKLLCKCGTDGKYVVLHYTLYAFNFILDLHDHKRTLVQSTTVECVTRALQVILQKYEKG